MNVAILGSGFIVPVFIENARQIKGYHLTALWGRNREKIQHFKDDVDYVTDDLEQVLNDKNVDAVYVALPNGLHYKYGKKAIEHGKHLIMEKPFCVTNQQAKQLFELGEQHHVLVFEAIMTKYNPCYLAAKDKLAEVGDIKIVNVNFSQYSRRYEKFKNGVIVPAFDKDLAGGSLMDLGVYNIHFVVGMLGKPKKVQYYGNIVNAIDPSGILILQYDNFTACLVNAKDSSSDSFAYIQGENGYIKLTSTTSRCSNFILKQKDGIEEQISFEQDGEFIGMKYELREFLRMFEEKDFASCKKYSQETLDVQDVLTKALESANLNFADKQ